MGTLTDHLTLRQLSLPTRLVLSLFLISVGVGYFSALVQLHFNGGAKAGEPLPDAEAAKRTYGNVQGDRPVSQLERLLEHTEGSFNGAGTMRPAFTTKSRSDWAQYLEKLKQKEGPDAEKKLLAEREGERLAMLEWARTGTSQFRDFRKAYQQDKFVLPAALANQPITEEYLVKVEGEDAPKERAVKIKSLFEARCVDCHSESGRSNDARSYPFEDIDKLKPYVSTKATSSGMSLQKLAQTTHVHLLGFSMLYGLTGLLFSLTSYPGWARCIFSPFTLVAQLADISCWWLARADPTFAQVIVVTGGLVAVGLAIQIIGSLFDMYNLKGKIILFILIVIAAVGGGMVHQSVIGPYLEKEKAAAAATSE